MWQGRKGWEWPEGFFHVLPRTFAFGKVSLAGVECQVPGVPRNEARTVSRGQCVKGCISYLGTVSFLPEGDTNA